MSEFIGVDVGGTKTAAVLIDDSGRLLDRIQVQTPKEAERFIDAAADAIEKLRTDRLAGAGVGLAGLVRWPEGVFAWGPHVPGTNVPAREMLTERLGVPVIVDNDANLTAYAEATAGAGRGHDHILLVTLGTGIGAAVVTEGFIYRGASFAGEFGHMTMVQGGPLCACGRRGCWETLASGPALARLAREAVALEPRSAFARRHPEPTSEDVIDALQHRDPTAHALVEQVGRAFGLGISNLVTAFDPDVVIVGGGLGTVGESLIEPARRALQENLHGAPHRIAPPLVVAELGRDAGAMGGALLAKDTLEKKS